MLRISLRFVGFLHTDFVARNSSVAVEVAVCSCVLSSDP